MKYMKVGTTPDHIFCTQEAVRTVSSDIPTDFTIRINNITFLLHKLPLLRKCGLLRRLYSESGNPILELHDIPGGEDAFQLCAKYCYGITIILSAHNFVSALCAAHFLQMTDTVDDDNFIPKLQSFFSSCILRGWKDSIAALQSTVTVPEWSESPGIIRGCIDSIVDKILQPPEKVTWSFTYTRVGYERKRVPKDWWTEDLSDLDIDLFRCIITAVRSVGILPPQLIGEALHVYAARWLPDDDDITSNDEQKKIVEIIVSLIPIDHGISPVVSTGFLLRLLRLASLVGISAGTKAELVRRLGWQLDKAKLNDLITPSPYDIDLVRAILHSFLKRQSKWEAAPMMVVGKLIDSYLEVVAMDATTSVQQLVSLALAIPEMARPQHDQLYKAISNYLHKHPDLPKADKREVCRILDCRKLSPETQREVVRNERFPLRTVVQLLFFSLETIRIQCNTPKQERVTSSSVEDPDHLVTERDEKRRSSGILRMAPIAPLRYQEASEKGKGKGVREPMIRQI